MTEPDAVSTASEHTACARHPDRPAAVDCGDCGTPLCGRCTVTLADARRFCWDCAARRGGLHHHRRERYVEPVDERDHVGPVIVDSSDAVWQFEAHIGDRTPHPLISGLSERLARAGAGGREMADDDTLLEDVASLQEHANDDPPPTRWYRRR